MYYLVLSILLSTLIIITFRIFNNFKISIVQAITVNYLVACVFGFLSEAGSFSLASLPEQPWIYFSMLMGLSLIVAFNLFALSAQKAGVAITAISSRMSVAIPITLGFILFNDSSGIVKIAGIILGLIAFYLTSKKSRSLKVKHAYIFLPLMLFVVVGVNDSLMKVAEHYYLTNDFVPFLATSFGFALIFGVVIFAYRSGKEQQKLHVKNIVAGIILGILNWYSTLFVLKGFDVFEVSLFTPVYNIGVVALSSIVAYVIFKEKLSPTNWIGIMLAIVAIILIANENLSWNFGLL